MMTRKNQNRFAFTIFFLFVAACICWLFIRSRDLKNNGILLPGTVLSSGFSSKSSVLLFDYIFFYKGKRYESDSPAGVTGSGSFIGKTFPVRFSPASNQSELLVTPRHFQRYGLAYPDSLAWVKEYLIPDF